VKKLYAIGRFLLLFSISWFLFGCWPLASHILTPTTSSGLFTRLGSTAPSFGPIYVGITREKAEKYLGVPVLTMVLDKDVYVAVYRYERERSVIETMIADSLDVATFGLGTYMVSPVDRFNGTWHLMAVTYEVVDKHGNRDRVLAVRDRPRNSPLAIYYAELSRRSLIKGEWDQGIEAATRAVSLDSRLASSYVYRARALYEKGRFDEAIRDCDRALVLDSKIAEAYNTRALAFREKGDFKSALRDFKSACKLDLRSACENMATVVVKK